MNPQNDNIVSNAGLFFIPQVPSDVDAILVAGLIVSIPPNPIDQCRSFSVRGGTQVSQALANAIVASPAQYQIRFGALGGLFGIPPNPVKAFQPTDPIIPTAAKCVAIVTGTF